MEIKVVELAAMLQIPRPIYIGHSVATFINDRNSV